MIAAVLIQVLVLVLTLAAASGVVPSAGDRPDAPAMVDATGACRAPAGHPCRTHTTEIDAPRRVCTSLTAGRVAIWIDQGRGPMPPPMA